MRKILDKLLKHSILAKQYVMKQDTIAAVSNLNSYAKRLEGRIATLEMKVASLQGESKEIPEVTHTPQSPYGTTIPSPYDATTTLPIGEVIWGNPPGTYYPPTNPPYIPRDLTESGIREM